MALWYEKVYKPYVASHDGESALLLDDFVCHKDESLMQEMDRDGIIRILIPPHYTGILQPCDVGINKSLKDRLKKLASMWRRQMHASLQPGQKLPAPTRKDVLCWLKQIWDEFPI